MKILLSAGAHSKWVKDYIEYVLLPIGADVFLTDQGITSREYVNFYTTNNVFLVQIRNYDILEFTHALNVIGPFDVIHIHGMWDIYCQLALLARRHYENLICSFWGSDLYRATVESKFKMEPYLDLATVISVPTKRMQNEFRASFGIKYDFKISSVLFGSDVFLHIDQILNEETKSFCRHRFGIDDVEIAIAVGYNRIPEQQHLKVLQAFHGLPQSILKRLNIILHFSGAISKDDYVDRVINACKKLKCKHTFISDYLSNEDIARLRIATDIFIHAQTTDAFSASMIEYIYAGATVFNPQWLHYYELLDSKINYVEYVDFSELTEFLKVHIETEHPLNQDMEFVRNKLKHICSWSSNVSKWHDLYK